MKNTYIFNVSKSEYGTVRVQAHSDEEADDRLKEILDEENVVWESKPEYSWDLTDIEGEDAGLVDDLDDEIDNEFGLDKDDE